MRRILEQDHRLAAAEESEDVDAPEPVRAVGEAAEGSSMAADATRALVCSYDWPCEEALSVAWCESRHDPAAVSPDGQNWGLMQINESTWRPFFGEARWSQVLEAEENVRMAWEIYQRAGMTWQPWSCKP